MYAIRSYYGQIRDLIKIIAAQGTTILLASHLLDEVEKVCTHVVVLRKGEMLYQGTVNRITSYNVCYTKLLRLT